jgi:hypothetical protein
MQEEAERMLPSKPMKMQRITVLVTGEDDKEKTAYSLPLSLCLDLSDNTLGMFMRMTICEHRKRFTSSVPTEGIS